MDPCISDSDRLDLSKLVSDNSEFVDFYPPDYTVGKTKYIFVTGGVMSGIGKGVFTSSLAHLLKIYGYSVSIVKMEGYLNIDSGTLNPLRHGEVFVLDDGTECDLDLGSYERFLDQNMDKDNFITSGRIYSLMLSKERQGRYLGRDVLVIPHLTGEIKLLWRSKALRDHIDFLLIEIGGTIGDYENMNFVEAARQMRHEEGRNNIIFCHVTQVLYSESSQELKSKPTQHSVKMLMQQGIQPDIIVARSDRKLTTRLKEKVSLYCNVPINQVIEDPDVDSAYVLPSILDREERIIDMILRLCMYSDSDIRRKRRQYPLEKYAERLRLARRNNNVLVSIVGKYVANVDSYISIDTALEHAGTMLKTGVSPKYVDSSNLRNQDLRESDAIIVPGGFGKRGIDGKLKAISYARTKSVPFLGLCLGFQLAVIEVSRNLCGMDGANTTEFDPSTNWPVIYLLPTQQNIMELGGTMRLGKHKVLVKERTTAYKLYQKKTVEERFRHRYEFNRQFEEDLEKCGVVFSGMTIDGEIYQILELQDHPFFICTQFHPEFLSRPLRPHPLFLGLVNAALRHKSKTFGIRDR